MRPSLGAYDEERGQPPYHPGMMVALLLYGDSRVVYSSRQLARACEERVDVMAVTGLNRSDFRTISDFRKRHLEALSELFVQILRLCRAAGLVRFGHVKVDGTKLTANASRHKPAPDPDPGAMSCGRMKTAEPRLAAEVAAWLDAAGAADAAEAAHRIILAHRLSTSPRAAPVPLVDDIRRHLARKPREGLRPSGPAGKDNLAAMAARGRLRLSAARPQPARRRARRRRPASGPQAAPGGDGEDARAGRPALALPVAKTGGRAQFRPDRAASGFRQFLLRGLDKVRREWAMIGTAHNLRKLAEATP